MTGQHAVIYCKHKHACADHIKKCASCKNCKAYLWVDDNKPKSLNTWFEPK